MVYDFYSSDLDINNTANGLDLVLYVVLCTLMYARDVSFFLFQAEDGIRDLVRSRGLGDVYKRQIKYVVIGNLDLIAFRARHRHPGKEGIRQTNAIVGCLLYTSDAADERSSVDLGGRRIIKKKKNENNSGRQVGH